MKACNLDVLVYNQVLDCVVFSSGFVSCPVLGQISNCPESCVLLTSVHQSLGRPTPQSAPVLNVTSGPKGNCSTARPVYSETGSAEQSHSHNCCPAPLLHHSRYFHHFSCLLRSPHISIVVYRRANCRNTAASIWDSYRKWAAIRQKTVAQEAHRRQGCCLLRSWRAYEGSHDCQSGCRKVSARSCCAHNICSARSV